MLTFSWLSATVAPVQAQDQVLTGPPAVQQKPAAENKTHKIPYYNLGIKQSLADWTHAQGQVWVVYGTRYCPSCRVADKVIFAQLKKTPITTVYVDIDKHRQVAADEKIGAVPVMGIYANGRLATTLKANEINERQLVQIEKIVTAALKQAAERDSAAGKTQQQLPERPPATPIPKP